MGPETPFCGLWSHECCDQQLKKSDLVTKLIHLSVHSFFAVWDFKFLQLEAYDVRQIIEYYLDVIICIVATLWKLWSLSLKLKIYVKFEVAS